MSAPTIPARPARSQHATMAANNDMPRIPPRPKRNVERSISPNRDTFARSPFNDMSFSRNAHGIKAPSNLAVTAPQRPPSVELPSIGQEGNEYAHIHEHNGGSNGPEEPSHTKNVMGDLPLHAPKASLPALAAKSKIAMVTRTDSDQAAAIGIGKPASIGGEKSAESRPHSRSNSSLALSRPQSIMKDKEEAEDHGIPEIGLQIPLYPNAGDVQAPTPSPYEKPHTAGIGFFNDGSAPSGRRHHTRSKSGREIFTGPPGSYGLHGHGKVDRDQFERNWYDTHPGEREKETQGAYGPTIEDNRHDWALSSDDLNRLVHESARRGIGMGASRAAIGTPDENVGYMASEEYTARMHSPHPSAAVGKPRTSSSHAHAESPLRKMSFPVNEINPVLRVSSHEQAVDSEAEDDVIHVDPLSRSASRITGDRYEPPAENLGPDGAEGGIFDEEGYGTPILASDEVRKTPGIEYLSPAVPPEQERRSSNYIAGVDAEGNPIYQSVLRHSRPSSRSGSLTGLHRFTSHDEGTHTPLEDVKEYEPLFPDDDGVLKTKDGRIPEKAIKRPDYLARHHFPSKDIWEDTPSSLMYVTTVETPPPDAAEKKPSKAFEPPEAEQARKEHISEADKEDFLSEHTKKFARGWNRDLQAEMSERPGLERRFPSQDIWEDSPSQSLITTIITPEPERKETSPQEAKKVPEIPSRPAKAQPPIPIRPAKKETSPVDKKAPVIPDRPKPQVPARPSKPLTRESAEQVPLAKTTSLEKTTSRGSIGSVGDATSEGVAVVEKKAPPPRPAKQFGGIKGGFISELQNKLQLGPQAPKKETPPPEEEKLEEKAPLADARKGRARGPQRRKPGVSPSAAAITEETAPKKVTFNIAQPWSVWEIGDDALLEVGKVAKPALELIPERTALRQPSQESITPPLQDDGSGQTAEDYFAPGSPSTSTKAAAKAAPAVQSPEEQNKPVGPDVPTEAPERKDEHPAEMHSPKPSSENAKPIEPDVPTEAPERKEESLAEMHSPEPSSEKAVQTGETVIEHGIEGEGKEKEKMTAYVDADAQGSGNVVTKGGEDVPSVTATAGEEQN